MKYTEENWNEDAEWVRRFKAGDTSAFVNLVDKYKEQIYKVCYFTFYNRMDFKLWDPEDAKDAAREAFVRSYEKIQTLKQDRAYYDYVKTIAVYYCKNLIEDRMREGNKLPQDDLGGEKPFDETDLPFVPTPEDPIAAITRKENEGFVRKALNKLKEKEKEVIVLKFYLEMTFDEIGEKLGTNVNTVKTQFCRALKKLSKDLIHLRESIE